MPQKIAQMHLYAREGILAKTGDCCPKNRIRKSGICEVCQENGGIARQKSNICPIWKLMLEAVRYKM